MTGLLNRIKTLVAANRYRVRIHAVRHMIEEGFDEESLLASLGGKSRILENYAAEMRCLVLGHFISVEDIRMPLHIVCDYSDRGCVDLVTAYVPQKPWWVTPSRRGRLT